MSRGILIVISGPSGAGKGTICKELFQSCSTLHYSISATTRMPRSGEQNGVQYLFLKREEFERMVSSNELLEWAEVYGNYYGTPRSYVEELLERGEDVVLEIDPQGAMQVKKKCSEGIFVYIAPPSLDELAKRIYNRGTDSPEVIHKRLGCAKEEMRCALEYHYIVVNDDLKIAVNKVKSIIEAEKCRVGHNKQLIDSICNCIGKEEF